MNLEEQLSSLLGLVEKAQSAVRQIGYKVEISSDEDLIKALHIDAWPTLELDELDDLQAALEEMLRDLRFQDGMILASAESSHSKSKPTKEFSAPAIPGGRIHRTDPTRLSTSPVVTG